MSYGDADFIFKIIIIGNYQAGKTSLIERYIDDSFTAYHTPTIGVDFNVKFFCCENKLVKSYIWDTAGQDRFMTIVSAYYRSVNGAILVFDLNCNKSFQALYAWMEELKANKSNKNIIISLVGNKCDIGNDDVTEEEINDFIKSSPFQISYIKASAKTGYNVNQIFKNLVENIYHSNKNISEEYNDNTIQINKIYKTNGIKSNDNKCCY